MDYQQKNILEKIYKKHNIHGKKIVFKQYRNLNEFRFFLIERINPNHRIKLLGQPKRKYIKDSHYNKIVNVGEIMIYSALLWFFNTDILMFWLCSLILTSFCFELIILEDPLKVLFKCNNWFIDKCLRKNNSISV